MIKQKEGRLVKLTKIYNILFNKAMFAYKKFKKVLWVGSTGLTKIFFFVLLISF